MRFETGERTLFLSSRDGTGVQFVGLAIRHARRGLSCGNRTMHTCVHMQYRNQDSGLVMVVNPGKGIRNPGKGGRNLLAGGRADEQ